MLAPVSEEHLQVYLAAAHGLVHGATGLVGGFGGVVPAEAGKGGSRTPDLEACTYLLSHATSSVDAVQLVLVQWLAVYTALAAQAEAAGRDPPTFDGGSEHCGPLSDVLKHAVDWLGGRLMQDMIGEGDGVPMPMAGLALDDDIGLLSSAMQAMQTRSRPSPEASLMMAGFRMSASDRWRHMARWFSVLGGSPRRGRVPYPPGVPEAELGPLLVQLPPVQEDRCAPTMTMYRAMSTTKQAGIVTTGVMQAPGLRKHESNLPNWKGGNTWSPAPTDAIDRQLAMHRHCPRGFVVLQPIASGLRPGVWRSVQPLLLVAGAGNDATPWLLDRLLKGAAEQAQCSRGVDRDTAYRMTATLFDVARPTVMALVSGTGTGTVPRAAGPGHGPTPVVRSKSVNARVASTHPHRHSDADGSRRAEGAAPRARSDAAASASGGPTPAGPPFTGGGAKLSRSKSVASHVPPPVLPVAASAAASRQADRDAPGEETYLYTGRLHTRGSHSVVLYMEPTMYAELAGAHVPPVARWMSLHRIVRRGSGKPAVVVGLNPDAPLTEEAWRNRANLAGAWTITSQTEQHRYRLTPCSLKDITAGELQAAPQPLTRAGPGFSILLTREDVWWLAILCKSSPPIRKAVCTLLSGCTDTNPEDAAQRARILGLSSQTMVDVTAGKLPADLPALTVLAEIAFEGNKDTACRQALALIEHHAMLCGVFTVGDRVYFGKRESVATAKMQPQLELQPPEYGQQYMTLARVPDGQPFVQGGETTGFFVRGVHLTTTELGLLFALAPQEILRHLSALVDGLTDATRHPLTASLAAAHKLLHDDRTEIKVRVNLYRKEHPGADDAFTNVSSLTNMSTAGRSSLSMLSLK